MREIYLACFTIYPLINIHIHPCQRQDINAPEVNAKHVLTTVQQKKVQNSCLQDIETQCIGRQNIISECKTCRARHKNQVLHLAWLPQDRCWTGERLGGMACSTLPVACSMTSHSRLCSICLQAALSRGRFGMRYRHGSDRQPDHLWSEMTSRIGEL